MNFRKSSLNDVDSILKIINQAQDYLKSQNIDQWQNGYPNEESIKNDIKNNESYVLEKNGVIIATTMVTFKGEPTYDVIYGKWLSEGISYATIHRLAVDNNYKGNGIASVLVKEVEKLCIYNNVHSIKVDTHEDNVSMHNLIKKNNFKYCGVIYLEDNSKRVAFEKLI